MNQIVAIRQDTSVLEKARGLRAEIVSRSSEIEANAAVPKDLLDKVQATGAFRMALDARFGGLEMGIREVVEVIREFARADASIAWHLMISIGSHVATARVPRATLDRFYADGPDTWPKGAFSPKGMAVPVEGGYRLSGRWPLASGAREFDWISLGFLIRDPQGVRMDGPRPDMRICVMPKAGVEVIETWDAVGLRGTRSDDLEAKDLFVPEDAQGSLFGASNLDASALSVNMPYATAPAHTAVVLGILDAALEDLATAAISKRPAFNPLMLMKDEPVFRNRFGELATKVDALDALNDACLDVLEAAVAEGRQPGPVEGARFSSAIAHIHHEATRLMDEVMMLAGSGAVYRSNAQQRRWRDLRCVAQHQAANLGQFGDYGKALVARTEAA